MYFTANSSFGQLPGYGQPLPGAMPAAGYPDQQPHVGYPDQQPHVGYPDQQPPAYYPPQAGVPTQQVYANPAMTTTHTQQQQQQSNVTIVHTPPAVQQAPLTPQPASSPTPISESANIVSCDNNFCYPVF